jgi:tetratricopeptide (TPR) repeat protein
MRIKRKTEEAMRLAANAILGIGVVLLLLSGAAAVRGQQIGKYVAIPAGSDADKALTEINAATDPAAKLALIDKFAAGPGQGDMAIVADDQYVNYYLAQKNYDKVFEYGEKLFALDPDNFANAVNLTRAGAEKGDADKVFVYGEKAQGIWERYKAAPAPEGKEAEGWEREKKQALDGNKDTYQYVQQLMLSAANRTTDATKKAAMFQKFGTLFPDSPYSKQAMAMAAASYRQAQNTPKMLEVANAVLAKDPNNLGMLLLLSDYYSEKGEQLDKAEAYATKAAALADSAPKPDGMDDAAWAQTKALQKGLALSSLGQVNIQKKENAKAVENFKAAAPLLKADDVSYGRNQYRLGFGLVNLKKNAEAKEAFTQAASVNSPYKGLAQAKLQELAKTGANKRPGA